MNFEAEICLRQITWALAASASATGHTARQNQAPMKPRGVISIHSAVSRCMSAFVSSDWFFSFVLCLQSIP